MLTDPQAVVDQSSNVVRLSADLTSVTPSQMLDQYLSGSIAALILPPSS